MAKRKKISLIDTSKTQKSIDEVKKQVDGLAKDIEIKSVKTRAEFIKMFDIHTPETIKQKLLGLAKQEGLTAKETADLSNQVKLLNKAQKEASESTSFLSGNIKTLLASFGGAYALKSFVSQMTNIRGEMEAMEKSFEVLTGSKEKSDKLLATIVPYATSTSYTVSDLSRATQTLLSFNYELDKTPTLLKQIGDIARGDSQVFQSLSLAFAQMSGTGHLRGQERMQMINAGFNPIAEIARTTGRSMSELDAEMSKGAITVKMVEDAFKSATSEGGRFYGMMEKNAGGIKNLENQMTGAFEEMFNQLGKNSEGAIKGFYKTGILIAENYKTIGRVLASLIATYGAYRAALVLTTAISNGATLAEIARAKAIALVNGAQKALNATMLANPYVLVTTLIVGAATAMWAFHDSTTAAEKAQNNLNKSKDRAREIADEEVNRINNLIDVIRSENSTRSEKLNAFNSLKSAFPSLFGMYETEKDLLNDIDNALDKTNKKRKSIARSSMEMSYEAAGEKWRKAAGDKSVKTDEYWETYQNLRIDLEKDNYDTFIDKMKEMSDSDLEQWNKALNEALKTNKESAKLKLGTGEYATGYYTKEEVRELIKQLEQTKQDRNATPSMYGAEYKAAQKEWDKAKSAFKAIQKDRDKFTLEQFEEAKKTLEGAEDKFKALGGKVEVNKTAEFSFTEYLQGLDYDARKSATKDRLEQLKIDEEKAIADNVKLSKDKNLSIEQTEDAELLIRQKFANQRLQIQEEEFKREQDKLQKEQEAREKSLEAFETYEVQKQSIIDRYAEFRNNATEKHDVNLINKAEKDELKGLDEKFFPKEDMQLKTLDLTRASTKQLKQELEGLRERIKDATDPKDVQALQDRINATLHTLENKTPFSIFKSNLKDALKDGKVDFELLGNAISGLVPELQGIANDARALFGDGVGDSLDGFVQSIDGLSDLSKSIGSFASGDILGGVSGLLSAGNKLFGNARKVNAEHREALRLLRLQKQEIENQVALSELRAKLEEKINIFGTDKWGQTKREADAYLKAKERLDNAMIGNTKNEAEIAKLQERKDKSNDLVEKWVLTNRINQLQEEQKSTLEQMQVVNGSRKSGWGPWRKRKDTWGGILDEYDDLVDAEGRLNIARAEAIMQNTKMKDEDKVALQDLIDNAHIMEDAYASIANNLKDTFGELGQTIMDAFAEASKSGINDFSKIEEAGGKMLEKLANEMIFNAVLGDLMDDYTQQMTMSNFEGLSDEEMFAKQTEIMDNFIQDAIARQDMFNQLQESSKNTMIEAGYTPTDNDKQDSSRGVQRNVSQDTMDEVNGRLTAVQISNESIAENTRIMAEASRRTTETISSISNMMQIGTYAWQDIANYTSVLPNMAKDMAEVKRNTRGLIK